MTLERLLFESTFVTILSSLALEQQKKERNLMTVSQDVLVQFDPNNVMVGIAGYMLHLKAANTSLLGSVMVH